MISSKASNEPVSENFNELNNHNRHTEHGIGLLQSKEWDCTHNKITCKSDETVEYDHQIEGQNKKINKKTENSIIRGVALARQLVNNFNRSLSVNAKFKMSN